MSIKENEENLEKISPEKQIETCTFYKSKTDKLLGISDVTDIIGGKGWWQIKIVVLSMLAKLVTAFNHLGLSFLALPVDHWCKRPSINISLETWWTHFVPNISTGGHVERSQCEMYVYNNSEEVQADFLLVRCESYEYSTEYRSIVNEWDLVCDREWMISSSQSVYMFGFFVATIISGQFADNYGRLTTAILGFIIHIVAGVSAAFSNSFLMFTICRFFIAIGVGTVTLVAYVIVVECLDSQSRVLYTTLLITGWNIGCMLLPLLAWLISDWFYLQLAITMPSVLMLSYFWLMPESPRWLLTNGYLKKALPILREAIKLNGGDDTDLEKKAKFLIELHKEEKKSGRNVTVLDLLRTPNLRMKTLCLYFIWFVIAFTYYALALSTNDLEGNRYINFFVSSLMEVVSSIIYIVTLDRFGRKKTLAFNLLVCGLAIFCCIFVPTEIPVLLTSLVMIGKLCITTAFSIVFLFSSEIYPTVARNIGVGSSSSMSRVGSAIAPFMRELGNATSQYVSLSIFAVLSISSAFVRMLLPETHNKAMPESIGEAECMGK